MALPANVSFGTVTGRFIRAVADTITDPDQDPDGIALNGLSIVFEANVTPAIVRNMAADPPVTILIDKVTATTDSNGVLIGPDGTQGVRLVAGGDTHLDPSGWSYRVSISSTTFPKVSFAFILMPDAVIDLSTVVPVPPNPGAVVSVWQQAVTDTLANLVAVQTAVASIEKGEPGGIAGLDADGDVVDAYGNKVTGGGGGGVDVEVVRDTIGSTLVAGANVTITPNDGANTVTIASADTNTTDPEVVRDTIAATLVAGTNVSITADDAGNTITIASTAGGSTDPEVVRDTMASALVAGSNVTITPNDGSDTITIAAAGGDGDLSVVVLPESTGSDTAALNTVLATASGKRVRGLPGETYTLTGPLVLPPGGNVELDMTGCVINGPANAAYLMNAAAVAARTVNDAVTTAGSATVTSATGNFTSADVGLPFGVLGAGANVGRADAPGTMYGTILSVNSTTSVTLSVAATSSKTGATASVYPARDERVRVTGGTWNGGDRVAQSLTGHGFLFRRVDGLTVGGGGMKMTSTGNPAGGARYAISIGDVHGYEVANIDFDVVSDGVHTQGPASRGSFHHLYGTTGDDMVAFTGVDGQSTTGSLLGDVEGDIEHITVTDIFATACLRVLKITSGVGANGVQRVIRGFHAARLTGTVQLNAVSITDYAGTTVFDGSIENVTCRPSGSPFYPMVLLAAAGAQQVRLRNIAWDSATQAPTGGVVSVTAAVKSLTVDGLTTVGSATGGLGLVLSASVGTVTLRGLKVPDNPASFHGVSINGASLTFTRIALHDIYRVAGGNLIEVASASTGLSIGDLEISDGYQSAGTVYNSNVDGTNTVKMRVSNWRQPTGAIAIPRSPAEISLSNVEIAASAGAVRATVTAATPIRVRTANTVVSSGTLLSRTATQSLSATGDARADLTILTPQDGDLVYNTNSGHAAGVGLAVYNSTAAAWDNLETDTATSGGGGGTTPADVVLYPWTLYGFKSWTFDTVAAISASNITGNVGVYTRQVAAGGTITNVHFGLSAAATGVTDARGVVYDSAGTLLGVTANMTSDTLAAGFKTWALTTPITGVAAGTVLYVAVWCTGGNMSALKSNSNSPVPAVMDVGTARQLQQSNTAYQTSVNPGTMGRSSTLYWVATS